MYYVDLSDSTIHEVPDNEEGSFSVLDVSDDMILCCSTSFQRPHKLKIAVDAKNPNWISISPENVIQDNYVFSYLDFDSGIQAEEIRKQNFLHVLRFRKILKNFEFFLQLTSTGFFTAHLNLPMARKFRWSFCLTAVRIQRFQIHLAWM